MDDQHRGLIGAVVLGDAQEEGGLFRSARCSAADGRQRLPLRDLSGAGKLGALGLSAPDLLHGPPRRHAFRRVGAAAIANRRSARDLPVGAMKRAAVLVGAAATGHSSPLVCPPPPPAPPPPT